MKKTSKSFTITEAAKKLGISRQAVHEAISKEQLKADWGEVRIQTIQTVRLISEAALKEYQTRYSRPRSKTTKKIKRT